MKTKLPGFSLPHFLFGVTVGIFSLLVSIQPVWAQEISIPFPNLSRLVPLFQIISPFQPLLRLTPLRPLTNPFGTPVPTHIPSPTSILTNTPTPIQTPIPSQTPTSIPTLTPSLTRTPTPIPSLTPTPIEEPTPTEVPMPTLTDIPTPTLTPIPTNTPIPSPSPTPTTGAEGLIAYWKMDEGNGVTVTDSSGNNHTLTLSNFNFNASSGWSADTPPSSLSPNTGSLLFDGIDDVGLAANDPAFNFSSSYTLETWIKAESQGSDKGILSKWGASGGSVVGYMMYFGGGQIVNFINGNPGPASSADLRGDNTWHHVAIVWDGSERRIYVDGVLEVSELWTEAPLPIDLSFMVGNYFAGGDPRNFKGNIDEVKIYNVARTQNEIIEDAGIGGTVVINEIMWMGSTVGIADEWIELRNTTGSQIDLTNWQVEKLGSSSDPNVIIPAGIIPPNGFFLISNNTRANSIIDVDPDLQTTLVTLDNDGEQLILKNPNGTIIDRANGVASWFAGDNTTSPKKSMERNSPPGDGSISTNWHTATISLGLDSGAMELATPKNIND